MEKIENQTFDLFRDISSNKVFANKEFIKCHLVSCSFSTIDIANLDNLDLVALRSAVRNMRFTNCEIVSGQIGPGIIEDVIIDSLKVKNHLQTFGTVFKHVTIKGVVDKLMITPYVDISGRFPDVQREFDEANCRYYKNVDWALDIREGLFKDCDIRGVPARLIKRDVQTQVIIKREKVLREIWKKLDLSQTYWSTAIETFLKDGFEDCVLVAPKKAKNFDKLLKGLNDLRDFGITEPD